MSTPPPWQIKPSVPISRRVNIYLPQPLTDRLSRLRDQGNEIAMSRVCQDALWEACNVAEQDAKRRRRRRA